MQAIIRYVEGVIHTFPDATAGQQFATSRIKLSVYCKSAVKAAYILTSTRIKAATYVQKRCCRKSRRLIYGPNFVCSGAKLLNTARFSGDVDPAIMINANFGVSKTYAALFYARTFEASVSYC